MLWVKKGYTTSELVDMLTGLADIGEMFCVYHRIFEFHCFPVKNMIAILFDASVDKSVHQKVARRFARIIESKEIGHDQQAPQRTCVSTGKAQTSKPPADIHPSFAFTPPGMSAEQMGGMNVDAKTAWVPLKYVYVLIQWTTLLYAEQIDPVFDDVAWMFSCLATDLLTGDPSQNDMTLKFLNDRWDDISSFCTDFLVRGILTKDRVLFELVRMEKSLSQSSRRDCQFARCRASRIKFSNMCPKHAKKEESDTRNLIVKALTHHQQEVVDNNDAADALVALIWAHSTNLASRVRLNTEKLHAGLLFTFMDTKTRLTEILAEFPLIKCSPRPFPVDEEMHRCLTRLFYTLIDWISSSEIKWHALAGVLSNTVFLVYISTVNIESLQVPLAVWCMFSLCVYV